jgi:DNA-binding SARP family transcriptional activator
VAVPLVAAARQPASEPGPTAAACAVRLRLLDTFELRCDGETVSLPMSAQRLLAFVALKRHPVLRPYAAGSLWTLSTERHACASLRSALWRLRRSGENIVESAGQQLRLASSVRVDYHEAEATARTILERRDGDGIELDSGALRAELLPDWYEDWVLIEQEYFRQLRLGALDALSERLADAGRLDEALAVGLAALECEPLRERAHRALVRIHLEQGNASEAIRQYRFCRRLLRSHLGVEPSEQMQELMRRL